VYSPEDYQKYDNFDAIDVSRVKNIPKNYDGMIGVPITFLDKYNPQQFEIIGVAFGNLGKELGVSKNYLGRTNVAMTKEGKSCCPYARIIIKHKK
jgi:hypothetical protein